MLGYVCKYTPVELLEAMGAEPVRIQPAVTSFNHADALMHPNVCSYAKAVLEVMAEGGYEGIVLTSCCDAIRRLEDVLKEQYPEKFIYMLDVPRKVNDFSIGIYRKRILELADAYSAFSGKVYSREALIEILERERESARINAAGEKPDKLRVGIIGARCPETVKTLVEDNGGKVVFDISCTGTRREEALAPYLGSISRESTDPEGILSSALLSQLPCLRMADARGRSDFIAGFGNEIDGIIYHTVKFCDVYSFEYMQMKKDSQVPILKIETDLTPQCSGQIKTRVEAFMESLAAMRGTTEKKIAGKAAESEMFYVMGIDSGSTSTNAVIMDKDKKIVASAVIRTGAKSADSAVRAAKQVLDESGISENDIAMTVSTGYGREAITAAGKSVTEISCHAKGARYFNKDVHTILDIGGQDSKAIRLDDAGEVADFVMNDKCAAGTGRFLEAMARTLEVDISELGPISFESSKEVSISSMCTVFAESEVISLIAQNTEKADIARGVHRSIAGKSVSLMKRVGLVPGFMMTGGVARNKGVVKEIEEALGAKIYITEDPDIVGAVGAALSALEQVEK
ncbi:MAG: acyl-CoA dehydratase activase [Lachnospiraceae bacterium]|nr:acyl-CoA dehydratase activase [Lachnospiraceae bacterium]